jgi:hydroxymethylbilane synthase
MRRLTIGTRGSALARWQADHVARELARVDPALALEQRILHTEGDEMQQSAAALPGPSAVGVFVKRIEQALLAREIDLAVHSLKDMPTDQPAGLSIAAVLERDDPRDALVSAAGWTLDELPAAARVGTGSARRQSQLLHRRPDLRIVPIRGNIDTRVGRVERGELDAVVLALAGLARLRLERLPIRALDTASCLPAVGQGALAVEIRAEDQALAETLAALDHGPTRARVEAERAFLRHLGGGCLAPATAHAWIERGRLWVEAVVGDAAGRALLGDREQGEPASAASIGERLARRLLVAGAGRVLAEARALGRAGA